MKTISLTRGRAAINPTNGGSMTEAFWFLFGAGFTLVALPIIYRSKRK